MEGLPARAERLTFHLRFLEKAFKWNPINGRSFPTKECYELFKETRVLDGNQLPKDNRLPIQWKLPGNNGFASALSGQPSRYWELEVIAETTRGDCERRFLLPVYARG